MNEPERPRRRGRRLSTALHDQLAARRVVAGQLISLANLVGRPVVDPDGGRVGHVKDLVVRWQQGTVHPPVVAVLVRVGRRFALVSVLDVTLEQTRVRLRTDQFVVSAPVRGPGDVALANDVLDRQLVDVAGVEVVRAADVYLFGTGDGWELAGVDVGQWALLRRVFSKRRKCPSPDRAIDWADLQTFVPRFSDPALPSEPATAAGAMGGAVRLGSPAADLHRLRTKDVAALLDSGLGRAQKAQLAALGDSTMVAAALRELEPAKLNALMSELDDADRTRLTALLAQG